MGKILGKFKNSEFIKSIFGFFKSVNDVSENNDSYIRTPNVDAIEKAYGDGTYREWVNPYLTPKQNENNISSHNINWVKPYIDEKPNIPERGER